jgi:GNAT superfamily N-acetyltransferase
MISNALTICPVTRDRWDDFNSLFEGRGGPKTCWCMIWRAFESTAGLTDKAARKAAMKQRISSNAPVGLIGYFGGAAAAWCSIAPRMTFKKTLGGQVDSAEDEQAIWSLTCFFVKRELRGRGISAQLIKAAEDHARDNGAKIIEAYPVDPESPSYRFSGFVGMFEERGFEKVGTAGSRRNVFRKNLPA